MKSTASKPGYNKWIAISIYELNLIAGFISNFDLLLQKHFLRSISIKWLNRDANGRFTFWWAFCLASRSVNHCSMPSYALPTFSSKDFSEFKNGTFVPFSMVAICSCAVRDAWCYSRLWTQFKCFSLVLAMLVRERVYLPARERRTVCLGIACWFAILPLKTRHLHARLFRQYYWISHIFSYDKKQTFNHSRIG